MLLTPKETAALLRTSTWNIHQLVKRGVLPAVRLSPRVVRIDSAEVEAYRVATTSGTTRATPAPAQAAR